MDGAAPGPASQSDDFSTPAVMALTVVATISVATGYYIQPILQTVGEEFALSKSAESLLASFFQMGLAVGLVSMLPLADTISARRLLFFTIPCQCMALVAFGLSTSFTMLMASAFAIGLFGTTPYVLPPYASLRSSRKRLGFVTGMLTGGVGCGILMARVIAGLLAGWAGWRSVFAFATVAMLFTIIPLYKLVLPNPREISLRYPDLLRSMLKITMTEPQLRVAAAIQACSFASFGVFWLGSAFYLRQHFHWSTEMIGAVGLLGIFSIVGAPFIGRAASTAGLEEVRVLSTCGGVVSWLALAIWQENLYVLALATALLTVFAVTTDICCRTKLYALSQDIRTRLNAIYTIAMLFCGAGSAAVVGTVWEAGQWAGVCALGGGANLIAMILAWKYFHASLGKE